MHVVHRSKSGAYNLRPIEGENPQMEWEWARQRVKRERRLARVSAALLLSITHTYSKKSNSDSAFVTSLNAPAPIWVRC